MASRGSPLLEVTFHRSLLRTLIEHSVVYSAENPSRATQIGRSDAHQYHTGRESAAGLPGHARLRPGASPRRARRGRPPRPNTRPLGVQKSSKTPLDQHGYYSAAGSFGPLQRSTRVRASEKM